MQRARAAVADHEIGALFDNRPNELSDRLGGILVVAVCIHDDVGPEAKARVYAAKERAREALPPAIPYDLTNASTLGNPYGVVGRPVVDDDHVDRIESR